MASPDAPDAHIDRWGTAQRVHDHVTARLCQPVLLQTRTTARERQWT